MSSCPTAKLTGLTYLQTFGYSFTDGVVQQLLALRRGLHAE